MGKIDIKWKDDLMLMTWIDEEWDTASSCVSLSESIAELG